MLWLRPSTLLLALVLAANVTLPLLHFWPDEARRSSDAPPAEPAPVRPVEPPPERAVAPLPVRPLAVPPIARRSLPAPPATVCRAWGPFPDPAAAHSLAEQLALPEAAYRIVEGERVAPTEYLVTIQAADSRRAAARLVEQLASQDVETHLLDRPGAVLAAGVFRSAARAETQRNRLAELGYDATVEPLVRTERAYHLLADVAADQRVEGPPAGACGDIARPR